jgi:y4mF family transcriptional regulator
MASNPKRPGAAGRLILQPDTHDGLSRRAQSANALASATVNAEPRTDLAPGRIAGQQPRHTPPNIPQSPRIQSAAELGRLIKASREQMKLTQQQFADITAVGRRFISELENGKPTLEFDRVLQVCQSAGIDLHARPRSSR